MTGLRKVAPDGGAYVSESSYFEPSFGRAYWGLNYPKLLAVKKKYGPDGLFSSTTPSEAKTGVPTASLGPHPRLDRRAER